jgi:hypothetical protein
LHRGNVLSPDLSIQAGAGSDLSYMVTLKHLAKRLTGKPASTSMGKDGSLMPARSP